MIDDDTAAGESATLIRLHARPVLVASGDAVTVHTPSTVGNFGPGFDVTSLAIEWGGDRITAMTSDEDRLSVVGPRADRIPLSWGDNCAAAAYDHLRQRFDLGDPVHLHIEKSAPPGSGLGSSASSSAAGALAFAKRHPDAADWTPMLLVEAATYGESRVAGAHGDDVAAAIQGGLSMVRKFEVQRITPPKNLHLAIVRPDLELVTKTMRAAVGTQVSVEDAVGNLADIVFLMDAMHRGDVNAIGRSLTDRIATPGRRAHLPFFDAVKAAARDGGATGCAISGSGPAMFTVAQDLSTARDLAARMADAVRAHGLEAEAIACRAERRVVWQDELST